METHLTSRRLFGLGIVLLSALVAVVVATSSNAAPKGPPAPPAPAQHTRPLHGHFRNIQQGPCGSATNVCSTFQADGAIDGTGLVSVDTFPDAANFGFSKAHTVIHTKRGDLTCHEAALFDLAGADHPFVDLCLIDGGTGDYAGATGYIQEVGTFDFANNVGQVKYYGKLTSAH